METIIKCAMCKTKRSIEDMGINKKGIMNKCCKICLEQAKKYREINKKNILEQKKEYYNKNKEFILAREKAYYDIHKDEKADYNALYYKNNKEIILNQNKIYRETHKDEISEQKKNYRKSELDRIIKEKIHAHKLHDKKAQRSYQEDEYITIDWVKDQLIKCSNNCNQCGKGLKLTQYEYRDPDQFSIDRLDNNLPHIIGNCQIICWDCNFQKK